MDKIRGVAVIVGSLRNDSINRKVADVLAEVAPAGLKLSHKARSVKSAAESTDGRLSTITDMCSHDLRQGRRGRECPGKR